jgi:hypothetical protein
MFYVVIFQYDQYKSPMLNTDNVMFYVVIFQYDQYKSPMLNTVNVMFYVVIFQYDQYKSPMENIGLQDSLLSRFDLLFIVLDKVSLVVCSSLYPTLRRRKSQMFLFHPSQFLVT